MSSARRDEKQIPTEEKLQEISNEMNRFNPKGKSIPEVLKFYYKSYAAVCRLQGENRCQGARLDIINAGIAALDGYMEGKENDFEVEKLLEQYRFIQGRESLLLEGAYLYPEEDHIPTEMEILQHAAGDGYLWALTALYERNKEAEYSGSLLALMSGLHPKNTSQEFKTKITNEKDEFSEQPFSLFHYKDVRGQKAVFLLWFLNKINHEKEQISKGQISKEQSQELKAEHEKLYSNLRIGILRAWKEYQDVYNPSYYNQFNPAHGKLLTPEESQRVKEGIKKHITSYAMKDSFGQEPSRRVINQKVDNIYKELHRGKKQTPQEKMKAHLTKVMLEISAFDPSVNPYNEQTLELYYKSFDAVCRFQGGSLCQQQRLPIINKIIKDLTYYSKKNTNNYDLKKLLGRCLDVQHRETEIAEKKYDYTGEIDIPSEELVTQRAAREGYRWALQKLYEFHVKDHHNSRASFFACVLGLHPDNMGKPLLVAMQKKLDDVIEAEGREADKHSLTYTYAKYSKRKKRNEFYKALLSDKERMLMGKVNVQELQAQHEKFYSNLSAGILSAWDYNQKLIQNRVVSDAKENVKMIGESIIKAIDDGLGKEPPLKKITFEYNSKYAELRKKYAQEEYKPILENARDLSGFYQDPFFAFDVARYVLSQDKPLLGFKSSLVGRKLGSYFDDEIKPGSEIDNIRIFFRTIIPTNYGKDYDNWKKRLESLYGNNVDFAILATIRLKPINPGLRQTLEEVIRFRLGEKRFQDLSMRANDLLGKTALSPEEVHAVKQADEKAEAIQGTVASAPPLQRAESLAPPEYVPPEIAREGFVDVPTSPQPSAPPPEFIEQAEVEQPASAESPASAPVSFVPPQQPPEVLQKEGQADLPRVSSAEPGSQVVAPVKKEKTEEERVNALLAAMPKVPKRPGIFQPSQEEKHKHKPGQQQVIVEGEHSSVVKKKI